MRKNVEEYFLINKFRFFTPGMSDDFSTIHDLSRWIPSLAAHSRLVNHRALFPLKDFLRGACVETRGTQRRLVL